MKTKHRKRLGKWIGSALSIWMTFACSSEPKSKGPEWIHEPTRIVDNGYIVYVGNGEAGTPEKAQFKAEGQALEDLANECSMIPKGTRLEDRFSEKGKYEYSAYVKIAVEFKDCEEVKKTVDPAQIKQLGNLAFTEQLKRYQDLIETGEMASSNDLAEVPVPQEVPPPPARASNWSENTHFYVFRQYVAYQKEIVVLSPPTAYASHSAESQSFTNTMVPATSQLQNLETQNPEFKNQPVPWSHLPERPKILRPAALSAQAAGLAAQHPSVP
ncbi:MAG: hypothetical protein ACXVB1_14725, partial [Pseudobdellovibrionaceae bacterium]